MTGDHIYIIPTQFHRPHWGWFVVLAFPGLGDPRQLTPDSFTLGLGEMCIRTIPRHRHVPGTADFAAGTP